MIGAGYLDSGFLKMAVVKPTATDLRVMHTLTDAISWAKVGGDPAVASSKTESLLALLGCEAFRDFREIASIDSDDFRSMACGGSNK